MRTVQLSGKTGPDGVLHVSVPVGAPETECEVVVVVQPKPPAVKAKGSSTTAPTAARQNTRNGTDTSATATLIIR